MNESDTLNSLTYKLSILVFAALLTLQAAPPVFATGASTCGDALAQTIAQRNANMYEIFGEDKIERVRTIKQKEGGNLYEVITRDGAQGFYKEDPARIANVPHERIIFDLVQIHSSAESLAQAYGLTDLVTKSAYFEHGFWGLSEAAQTNIQIKPGVMTAAAHNLETPLDEWLAQTGKSVPDNPEDFAKFAELLKTEKWSKLYAEWKIFWNIFLQVDLSIENLARTSDGSLRLFDISDGLNPAAVRSGLGVPDGGGSYNFPSRALDQFPFPADYKLAGNKFKEFARRIAKDDTETIAKNLGLDPNESLPGRGLVKDLIVEMKKQAEKIVAQL